MRILAVIGVPGVGKTTLMWGIIEALGGIRMRRRAGLLDMALLGPPEKEIVILGRYEWGSIFGGTDQLSTAVQSDAVGSIIAFKDLGVVSVAFEGDRLATTTFFNHCASVGELRVVVVRVKPETLKTRRAERGMLTGKTQDATWLKGRETKVNSLAAAFSAEILELDTYEQVAEAVNNLSGWLRGT